MRGELEKEKGGEVVRWVREGLGSRLRGLMDG